MFTLLGGCICLRSDPHLPEQARSWRGLLIEANPRLHAIGGFKQRKCYRINAALATTPTPQILKFQMLGSRGGLHDHLGVAAHAVPKNDEVSRDSGQVVDVPAYSLSTLMHAIPDRLALGERTGRRIGAIQWAVRRN